jgi:Right handed beta helix region
LRITDNVIRHEPARACDGCGIGVQIYGNDILVARNTITDAERFGIELDDFQDPGHSPAVDNVIRDNVVRRADIGIAIGPEAGGVVLNTLIRSNFVVASVHDGIQLTGPSTGLETSTLTGNVANRNGDWGIQTVVGTNDGGHNRASGNGEPGQCLNIACAS